MIALGITFIEAKEIFIYKQDDEKVKENKNKNKNKNENVNESKDKLRILQWIVYQNIVQIYHGHEHKNT